MATLIGSAAASGVQPRQIHVGLNVITSVYSLTATLSAGDIIQMCKLPDGARVVDTILSTIDAAASPIVVNVGTRAASTKFIKSISANMASPTHMNQVAGLGAVLDTSDDATTRYTMIEVTCTTDGTGTKSGAITLSVLYHMDSVNVGT